MEGIQLEFKDGKVIKASAEKNEEFLLSILDTDEGARYLGEFAIGTNYGIQKFTKSILFDEKIGGSFHMALGVGYPETGSKNSSHPLGHDLRYPPGQRDPGGWRSVVQGREIYDLELKGRSPFTGLRPFRKKDNPGAHLLRDP